MRPRSEKTVLDTRKLAEALKRAAGEHGRPNSFGADELEAFYGGPPVRVIQRIGRDEMGLKLDLYVALGGYVGWGSAPAYHRGRFYV